MSDPQKDDHIEELLGKLQGIFGKLSHSEEEEAKQKIEISGPAPQDPEARPTPTPPASSAPSDPQKPAAPAPLNLYSEPPVPTETAAPPEAASPPVAPGVYESSVTMTDPEKITVPTALYYPPGRETEAKSLAQKLETMTPKFTKVAFRLQVGVFLTYDPKGDWKQTILAKADEVHFQTVFVVMDRSMDDTKRKSVSGDLEAKNIYFQEVPLASIEKKAFYTDILLGLVFFFDSRKPPAPPEES